LVLDIIQGDADVAAMNAFLANVSLEAVTWEAAVAAAAAASRAMINGGMAVDRQQRPVR
jgi:hypothetical protein